MQRVTPSPTQVVVVNPPQQKVSRDDWSIKKFREIGEILKEVVNRYDNENWRGDSLSNKLHKVVPEIIDKIEKHPDGLPIQTLKKSVLDTVAFIYEEILINPFRNSYAPYKRPPLSEVVLVGDIAWELRKGEYTLVDYLYNRFILDRDPLDPLTLRDRSDFHAVYGRKELYFDSEQPVQVPNPYGFFEHPEESELEVEVIPHYFANEIIGLLNELPLQHRSKPAPHLGDALMVQEIDRETAEAKVASYHQLISCVLVEDQADYLIEMMDASAKEIEKKSIEMVVRCSEAAEKTEVALKESEERQKAALKAAEEASEVQFNALLARAEVTERRNAATEKNLINTQELLGIVQGTVASQERHIQTLTTRVASVEARPKSSGRRWGIYFG